jgi:hypothetical protein
MRKAHLVVAYSLLKINLEGEDVIPGVGRAVTKKNRKGEVLLSIKLDKRWQALLKKERADGVLLDMIKKNIEDVVS